MRTTSSILSLRRVSVAVLLTIYSASTPSWAAAGQSDLDTGRLTADEVVAAALASNPSIEAARQRLAAARELPAGRRSLPDPTLRFGGYSVPTNSLDPLDGQLRLQLQQSFPYPGTLERRAAVAEREHEWVAQSIPRTEIAVAAAARRAYYGLWYATRAGTIHHGHLELVRQLSDSAQERYAAGQVPQENVLRALQELTALLTEIAGLERDAATARVELNSILHRGPSRPFGSPEAPRLDQLDGHRLEELLAEAERLSPALAASRARVAVEQARIESERHESKPDFGVTAEWWTASDGMGGRFGRYAVLGTLTLPWVHKDKYVAALGEAISSRAAAEAERAAARDRVFEAVASAWERASAAERIAELYTTTLLPQSEQSLRAARAAYETSRADFVAVVDNERTLLTNRLGVARIEADYGRAIADLMEAIGITHWDQIRLLATDSVSEARSGASRTPTGPAIRTPAPAVDIQGVPQEEGP